MILKFFHFKLQSTYFPIYSYDLLSIRDIVNSSTSTEYKFKINISGKWLELYTETDMSLNEWYFFFAQSHGNSPSIVIPTEVAPDLPNQLLDRGVLLTHL